MTTELATQSRYKPEYADQIYQLALLGKTNAEIAEQFNVSRQTLDSWANKVPEVYEALRRGKDEADAKVADAMYQRATGNSTEESVTYESNEDGTEKVVRRTVKKLAPDPAAGFPWLRNRQKSWNQNDAGANLSFDLYLDPSGGYRPIDASVEAAWDITVGSALVRD